MWAKPDGYIGTFRILWHLWPSERSTVLWATILVPFLYHIAILWDNISKPYRTRKFWRRRGVEQSGCARGRHKPEVGGSNPPSATSKEVIG